MYITYMLMPGRHVRFPDVLYMYMCQCFLFVCAVDVIFFFYCRRASGHCCWLLDVPAVGCPDIFRLCYTITPNWKTVFVTILLFTYYFLNTAVFVVLTKEMYMVFWRLWLKSTITQNNLLRMFNLVSSFVNICSITFPSCYKWNSNRGLCKDLKG